MAVDKLLILPCPFCGSQPQIGHTNKSNNRTMWIIKCPMQCTWMRMIERDLLIHKWNMRVK